MKVPKPWTLQAIFRLFPNSMALTFGGSNTPGLTKDREEIDSTSHVTAEDAGFWLESEWAQDLERGEGKEGAAFRKKMKEIRIF